MPPFWRDAHERHAARNWDRFYRRNGDAFYKDRHYLERAFPEEALPPAPPPLPPPRRGRRALLELGCGVGNAVFPLLQQNRGLYVYALDLAPSAIALLRGRRDGGGGDGAAGGGDFAERCYAEVHDAAAADALPCAVTAEGGVDMVMLMFALSAVAPEKHARVMAKAAAALRPGGVVLFRDYGRYDEAQLRLPAHARIADNFYARADGTRAYYFDLPDVAALAAAAGLEVLELEAVRRRCANRKTSAVFNRVWVHAKLRRPAAAA
ncbi:S-adenosyl-L-methionine-dependent methyltransferase [Tribonema minus]|uniref:tRNA N(3)-methylcytidine methyltransferase n=1 Tax=Tribonema minus TaxID=303371 RepID=A0A835Z8H9_9STRA|nr:S-adenosyl-L-methionine-dependent methyltransferase [Tribonema minus]